MTLMTKITQFARSPQGRQFTQKAMKFAQSPEGKRKIAEARGRVSKRKTR